MPIISFSMFFLSFTPLWVSIIFIDLISISEKQTNNEIEKYSIITIVILLVISILIVKHYFRRDKTSGSQEFVINSAKEEKTITSEYMLAYILPLAAFDFTDWHKIVLFIIFFFVLLFLCIRHNYFSVNIIKLHFEPCLSDCRKFRSILPYNRFY